MPSNYTGVAWSPEFSRHDRGPGSAFLPRPTFLPDERWDRGQRVECLYDILEHVRSQLTSVDTVSFQPATEREILEFHSESFVRSLASSECYGGTYIAAGLLAVGAVRELCRRVWKGQLTNGYALVRPAGHHSDVGSAGGGCMFANGVLAALELKRLGADRILYLDWDAHHGNSQQCAFWSDPSVLTVSVHQGRAFPPGTGGTDARGAGQGHGTNINIPVPPGSGGGVYRTAFRDIIKPAAEAFRPDFILVSSGLDANYIDPSARLCLHSGDYAWMTDQVATMAADYCHGRLVMTHEGGYSLSYLPLCFLRIVERLSGCRSGIDDPFLARWGCDFGSAVSVEAQDVLKECAGFVEELARRNP